ncbi:MAG: hypothetical protein LC656_03765, partial [Sphingomonadales bacterium]|nr:hypothetical protein [Sphingomonadales bacterium]
MQQRFLAPLDAQLLDQGPLDSGPRWLVPALVAAAAASGALLFWAIGANSFALIFFAGFVAMLVAAFVLERRAARVPDAPAIAVPDLPLIGTALALITDAAVLTDAEGQLLVANPAYRERFPDAPPPLQLGSDDAHGALLLDARTRAWRDGSGSASLDEATTVEVSRAGARGDLLLWRFLERRLSDPLGVAAARIAGETGERLAEAGVLAALVDGEGRLRAANKLFANRALIDPATGD